jgi:hypothetical protein
MRRTGQPEQFLKIGAQVDVEVASLPETVLHTARRISERVHDEGHGRCDTALFEPRPGTRPVSEQVGLGQDELEWRIGQGACAGRGRSRLRGVLGGGGGRPAEDRHDDEDNETISTYGRVH